VRGDLDAIALKALAKHRARRYGSPSDFAADIWRYLNHEPALACSHSRRMRASWRGGAEPRAPPAAVVRGTSVASGG